MSDVELPELSEKNFKRLTPVAMRVFAFRAAVRVMPMLGGTNAKLEFWPKADRARYLTVIMAAIDVVFLMIYKRNVAYDDAAYAAS